MKVHHGAVSQGEVPDTSLASPPPAGRVRGVELGEASRYEADRELGPPGTALLRLLVVLEGQTLYSVGGPARQRQEYVWGELKAVRQAFRDAPELKRLRELEQALRDAERDLQRAEAVVASGEANIREALATGQDPWPVEEKIRKARQAVEDLRQRVLLLRRPGDEDAKPKIDPERPWLGPQAADADPGPPGLVKAARTAALAELRRRLDQRRQELLAEVAAEVQDLEPAVLGMLPVLLELANARQALDSLTPPPELAVRMLGGRDVIAEHATLP
jgi:hypothetical protein